MDESARRRLGGVWRIFRIAQFVNHRLYDASWLFLSWLARLFVCAVFLGLIVALRLVSISGVSFRSPFMPDSRRQPTTSSRAVGLSE
jgi:hypothetical protein